MSLEQDAKNPFLFLLYLIKMKILYDNQLMKFITLFETITRSKVKDAFIKNSKINFIIVPGTLRNRNNLKRVESLIKKRVKVTEFNQDICKFVSNMLYPIKPEKIEFKEKRLFITVYGAPTKGLLIGRGSKNLKDLKDILSRYFEIEGVKII